MITTRNTIFKSNVVYTRNNVSVRFRLDKERKTLRVIYYLNNKYSYLTSNDIIKLSMTM